MECQKKQNVDGQPVASARTTQDCQQTGLFQWGHFDDNLGRHGRFSSAIRWIGVFPVLLMRLPLLLIHCYCVRFRWGLM